jgi:hypothetical protein
VLHISEAIEQMENSRKRSTYISPTALVNSLGSSTSGPSKVRTSAVRDSTVGGVPACLVVRVDRADRAR